MLHSVGAETVDERTSDPALPQKQWKKSLHILRMYRQTKVGINPSPNRKGGIPSCISLLFYLWTWVILWQNHRESIWGYSDEQYNAVIQHCDAKNTTKNQPQAVWHLCKSSQPQGEFPAARAYAEPLETVHTEHLLWKPGQCALKNNFKPIWRLSCLVFLPSGRGGRRWLFASESVNSSNEVWMADRVSIHTQTP